MEDDEIKTKIVESLEPEELQDLRRELADKEEELGELGGWEIDESEVDEYIDDCYSDVDIIGVKYSCSRLLKVIDECRYDDIKNEIEGEKREEQEEELQDEIDDLQEQIDNYE